MTRDDIRFAVGSGLGALAFLVFVFVLYPVPVSSLVVGLFTGSLSALIAVGLVLVYRANRIVNFAQGELGGLAAVLAASLIVGPGWGFLPAMAVGLVAALALGALIEVTVVRRFAKAPRLLLTVATIGIGQLLSFGTLALPRLFDYDVAPQPPRPFGSVRVEWFPNTFTGGHLLIALVVPSVCVGLAVFLRRSRFGIAVRASAESADRASLLGIPVRRLNTLVWVLAAGLSGLAVLLRMPIQGVAIGQTLGLSLLLRALAAAVIGRMESLPVTFAAALGLGVLEQAVFFETGRTVVVDGVLFAVIIGALLVQRRGGVERARDLGASTWQALREVRPIPRELRHLTEVRVAKGVGAVLVLGLLVLYPLRMQGGDVFTLSVGLLFGMLMLSLVILTGWAGQISLGQLALAAIGAAVSATLYFQGKDFFLCVAAAGARRRRASAVALGVPALRIQGPFLAVTTMAFALTTGTFFLNREFFAWLVPDPNRLFLRPVIFDKFDLESEHTFYYVALAGLLLTVASVSRIQRSRTGRALVANRDNSRSAQSYGINPNRAQISAFGLSGAIAGLAGGLYAFAFRGISGTVVTPESNVLLLAIGVIGGLSSVPGAMLGAGYMTFVQFSPFTREPLTKFLASGVGLLAILLVAPGGLGGLAYDTRDRLLRRLARRRGIVVPSLVADIRAPDVLDQERRRGGTRTPSRSRPCRMTPLLVVRDLEVAYGKTQVLFGVDFHVGRGEMVALLGTNGAGKSTLLSAICGLLRPAAGTDHLRRAGDRRARPAGHGRRGRGPDAGRQGRLPDPHRRREPAARRVAVPRRPRPRPAGDGPGARVLPRAARTAGRRRPATSPAASSRCSPSVRRSSPGPGCCSSTSSASAWRRSSSSSSSASSEPSTPTARRSFWSSSRSTSPSPSPNGPCSSRRARCGSTAPRASSCTTPRSSGPCSSRARHRRRVPAACACTPSTNGHRPFVAHCEHCGHDHPVALELDGMSASLRRGAGRQPGGPVGPPGPDPRHHRAQRCGEDDGAGPHLGLRDPERRSRAPAGRRRHGAGGQRPGRARSGPLVPGRPAVPVDDRAPDHRHRLRAACRRARPDLPVRAVTGGEGLGASRRRGGRCARSS